MKVNRILAVSLAGLLQLAPMLRAVLPLRVQGLAPASWAWVLKLAGTTAALLGSYDAVSGATQIVAPYTVNGTVGTPYSRQLTTSGQTAHSWSASTAALGTSIFPLTPGLWLTNSNGRIGGTPTAATVSTITISAWENSGNSGASVSSVFTFTIVSGGPTAPTITTQPSSQTSYAGASANFAVTASGTAPLAYQWRFQGAPIANATASAYARANLQLADAGAYTVVVTNGGGGVTSSVATLTVLPPSADIIVRATGPPSVLAGAAMTCVVALTNLGPTVATNVVVSDSFPPTVIFVSATAGGVASGGVVTWPAIALLPVGGKTNFSATFTAPASGSFTNVASVAAGTADPNPANNNGSDAGSKLVTSVTPQADVSTFASGPANVNAAATFSYTVTVTNLGPSTASNLVVVDTLPATVAFVSATAGGGASNGVVTWPVIPSLASGAALSFSVTVTAPPSGVLNNVVSSSATTLDPVAANNNGSAATAIVTTTVQPQADLAVFVSGATVSLPGSNLTYTVTVTNIGPSTAGSVVVADAMPAGATFVSGTGGGSAAGGMVTWPAISSLVNGGTASFSLTIKAPLTGPLTNRASATAATPDPVAASDGTSAAATVITSLNQFADVVAVQSGPALVTPGGSYTYTLTLTNLGPSTASNVVVVDTLPPTAIFGSATGGGIAASGVVTWPAIAALASGATASFSLTVSAPAAGVLTNTVSSTSVTLDPAPANNNGTAAAAIVITQIGQQADLAVFAVGTASVLPGSNLTCTITVTNFGVSTASNVVVASVMPPGAAFVSATGGGAASGGGVTWPAINSLANGAGTTFTLVLKAPVTGPLTNIASATSTTTDPNPANNNGTAAASRLVTTVTPQADLVVASSGPATVNAAAPLSYTVTVTNLGPSAATNVAVTDTLPPTAVFVSATGSGVAGGGVVAWPVVPALAAGATLSFTVTVNAPAAGTLTNRAACTSPTFDPGVANNDGTAPTASVITTVQTVADLVVRATGPASVLANYNLNYTVTVSNSGPSAASNVVVSDRLPSRSVLVSAPGASVSSNVVTWPALASLGSGSTMSFTVTVKAPASGALTNIASALSDTPDPNSANNNGSLSASRVTTAVTAGQFGINSGAQVLNPQTGLFEQSVTITNLGANTAQAVRLYVTGLRSGVQLYNATGTNSGRPYVQYNAPLDPNRTVTLLLEFWVLDRLAFTDTLQAEAVLLATTGAGSGTGVSISRAFMDTRVPGASRFVVEFATVPGQVYTVLYSDDTMRTWKVATPSITAGSTSTQWYDDGPPKTDSSPPPGSARLYRVNGSP